MIETEGESCWWVATAMSERASERERERRAGYGDASLRERTRYRASESLKETGYGDAGIIH